MQLLDANESLELLSLHAFGFKTPMEGYNGLAKEVLQYCEGNPLALEVLGSSLSEDISIKFWSTQDLLERDENSGIQRVLVRSYNSLPNNHNEDLFLHIACFFVGEDKDYVEKILEPDYGASHGIKVLTNRCLLSVSPDNKLVMHKLIQQMARSLIRQESKHRAERSRAWLSKDAYKIMHKEEGSKTMEGLALDMQMLDKQMLWNDGHERESSSYLKTDSLRSMDNLKLLQLNHVHLTGSYNSLSEGLRLLCWGHFHLAAIPSGLFKGNLVAIDMRYSNLDVFEPPIVLQSLKILNLHGSKYLREILAKLDETELGHLAWLKRYQSCKVFRIGYGDRHVYDIHLDRENDDTDSYHMEISIKLYEFGIISTSLPDYIEDPNMMPDYISDSPSVSFDVPPCPKNRRLKGLEVTFRYTSSSESKDVAWFAKIHTTSGVDLMYNPNVFGIPGYGERAIWLSYWPIGNKLDIGDKVTVSIVAMKGGLWVRRCGARLLYTNDLADKTLEDKMGWVEPLGEDLSRFQLSTGAYYLCRREFSGLNPGWLGNLVGDTIDDTEVRGWKNNGRPKSLSRSYREFKEI